MGKRSRQRRREEGAGAGSGPALAAPTTDYTDAEGAVLTLRGALSPATRREYAAVLAGADRPAATVEDAAARALELLFERLAVRWVVAGVETSRQRELVQRFRVATPAERAWVRERLREHAAEWFPELRVP